MKGFLTFCIVMLSAVQAFAQSDVKPVRSGNRKFKSGNWTRAELDYRRALANDSTSVAATYNLASSLYRQNDFDGAQKTLSRIPDEVTETSGHSAAIHYNKGDVALQNKDYRTAVDEFRAALLQTPDDMDAKENYIYAKLMLQNQQNQQDQQPQDQNQNQQPQDQNQNQDQQPQSQPQDRQDQKDRQEQQPQDQKMSPQQAQQILKAIQAKEKETQEKVDKEKAEALKARQKEKNW